MRGFLFLHIFSVARILKYHSMSGLKRTLNLTEVVFFASGVILGAGIYTIIGKAAGASGNMLWLSFSIAALTALLSLFAYAELSSVYPSSGGEFTYVQKVAGQKWAYAIGAMVSLTGIISAATISIGFAGYLSELVDLPQKITALGVIAFILCVNILGIRQSSGVNIIFTILETLGLLFVIVTAAPSVGETNLLEKPQRGIHDLLAGAAICFFAFTGFEDAVKLADETKKPEKNIPRGLFTSAVIVMCIYLCVAIVVVSMIPFQELAESDSPLSTVVEKRFGKTGSVIIAVVALFSTSNSLLSNMLGSSRVIYNIGKETKKLSLFGKVLPGRKTPAPALLLAASVCATFSLVGDIRKVALITNFLMFLTFLVMNVTLIYMRFTKPDIERPFKIPFNVGKVPLLSVVAIVLLLVMIAYSIYGLIAGTAEAV
jgi:basic amino acid/polyamine antiporter, APA family